MLKIKGIIKKHLSLLIILSFISLPSFAFAFTKAVVMFPILGQGGLSEDIYLYKCDDSSCETKQQLEDYGHITNVHRWPKSTGGPGGPVPATWAFLTLTEGEDQYFEFWQETAPTVWASCILGIKNDGTLDTAKTTCVGVVVTPPINENDGVPAFSMGTAMFSQSQPKSDPGHDETNTLPPRGLTFVNNTSAQNICLQTDSSFDHDKCSGANKISYETNYTIDSSTLKAGSNSGIAQISGFQWKDGHTWVNTGMDSSGSVYATNMEWTIWPEQSQFTSGPTTIDISLVNGFNVGVSLTPDRDTVCYVADSEGGVPYFVLQRANVPMAMFPNPHDTVDEICPNSNLALDSSGMATGCYSSCTYAKITDDNPNEACCSGAYNSVPACTTPPGLPYVQNIDANSTRVYSWAYEDWRGTFTCEPSAKFTFTISDPPLFQID